MTAEHIAWALCFVLLAVAYGCALYVLVVARQEAREQAKDLPHPHGHLPSDYDYREER